MAKTSPTREPVVVIMSLLAAAQVFAAGSAFADLVSPEVAGAAALAVAAIQVGVQFWVRGKVTPVAKE